MSTVDDAIESGALALAEMATAPAAEAIRAAWPLLSDGLRELHQTGPMKWRYPGDNTPRRICSSCDVTWPCPTARELDRIDKELANGS